jgi:hypothetical protein
MAGRAQKVKAVAGVGASLAVSFVGVPMTIDSADAVSTGLVWYWIYDPAGGVAYQCANYYEYLIGVNPYPSSTAAVAYNGQTNTHKDLYCANNAPKPTSNIMNSTRIWFRYETYDHYPIGDWENCTPDTSGTKTVGNPYGSNQANQSGSYFWASTIVTASGNYDCGQACSYPRYGHLAFSARAYWNSNWKYTDPTWIDTGEQYFPSPDCAPYGS